MHRCLDTYWASKSLIVARRNGPLCFFHVLKLPIYCQSTVLGSSTVSLFSWQISFDSGLSGLLPINGNTMKEYGGDNIFYARSGDDKLYGGDDFFDDLLAGALRCLSHRPLLSGYVEPTTLS